MVISPETTNALAAAGGAAALAIAAVGSVMGAGAAGQAAVGAWKKCYLQKKQAPFLLAAFVGAPLSQTIYGFLLMNTFGKNLGKTEVMVDGVAHMSTPTWALFLIAGILAGLGMGASAWIQGKAGAAACDAFGETGEGFTNYLVVLGIIETVALFVMLFIMTFVK